MIQKETWSTGSVNNTLALARLLRDTNFIYRSPGIRDNANLLLENESYLGWQGPVLQSALVAGGEDWPVADLLLCAVSNSSVLVEIALQALPRLEARVLARGGRWLRILNGPAWLVRQLIPRYEQVDTIVFYERSCSPEIHQPEPLDGLRARCVLNDDLLEIKQVDEASFAPFWQVSVSGLGRWQQNANLAVTLSTGNQIVAFILARIQGDTGNVYRLAVLPEWQGRGLGRWLMTRIITDMQAHGAATITLNTQACNQRARSLYERMGFTLTGHEVSAWARDLTLR
jgi:ribosomal protein S18 acetylase RimI-like enzyme